MTLTVRAWRSFISAKCTIGIFFVIKFTYPFFHHICGYYWGAATNTDNTVLLDTTSRHLGYVIWKLYYTYIYKAHWVARWSLIYVNISDVLRQFCNSETTYLILHVTKFSVPHSNHTFNIIKYWARFNEFKGILVCYHSKWQQLWRENFLLKLLALILNGYCPSERRRVVVKRKLSRDLKCNLKKWSRRW